MLQTVEAEYENGVIRLLEKPKFTKAHAFVTFIPAESEATADVQAKQQGIDWENVKKFKGHAEQWLGCAEGVNASCLREEKANYILEKHT